MDPSPVIIRLKSMRREVNSILNYSVVSFYDNFGLIFKGPEDKATKWR